MSHNNYFFRVVLDRPSWKSDNLLIAFLKLSPSVVLDFANKTLLDKLNVNCMASGSTNVMMVC